MITQQISTIILLLLLGFFIYYLTRPSCEEKEDFTDPFKLSAPHNNIPASKKLEYVEPSHNTQDIVNQIIAETETNTNNPADLFNFKPNLETNDMGAELDLAFDKNEIPVLTPDVVNINKNNVSKYDAKDFLPKEINDQWFDTDFSQAKFNINDDKLINTERYIIGINTVGQSLKNASYDIRGAIPNPKYSISPWNNSTIEADYNIKSLC